MSAAAAAWRRHRDGLGPLYGLPPCLTHPTLPQPASRRQTTSPQLTPARTARPMRGTVTRSVQSDSHKQPAREGSKNTYVGGQHNKYIGGQQKYIPHVTQYTYNIHTPGHAALTR